jgi:DNA repair protein RadC
MALLARWQGLAAVVSADLEAISDIIGRPAALQLKFLQAVLLRLASGFMVQREVITSSASLEAYLRVRLSGLPREQFRVLFLDKRNRLIADEALGDGTIDHAPVYPREIVRRALQLDACALILAHNHPSGDATPSEADIAMTKVIISACNVMGIKVHDHVVVGGRDVVSLRALGCF